MVFLEKPCFRLACFFHLENWPNATFLWRWLNDFPSKKNPVQTDLRLSDLFSQLENNHHNFGMSAMLADHFETKTGFIPIMSEELKIQFKNASHKEQLLIFIS